MKTTIDIADSLFHRAKQVTRRQGITLKQLVDEGLEKTLRERDAAPPARIVPVVFKGKGLHPAFSGAAWPVVRDTIHRLGDST